MAKLLRIVSALVALGLMPAAAVAQRVNYDYDKTTNFARVRSYALKSTTGADDPLVDRRITNAIARGLAMRGMRVDENAPDVYVVPHLTKEIRPQVTAYNNGWGWGWYGGITTFEVQDLQYDTLTIDLVDARTGQLLWRGTGVKQVNPHWKPETVDRKVNEAVTKILRNFPPVSER